MRVAVVGGGVAGSACALALARTGSEVTVHEAYADPAGPVGSYVSLAVNGLAALDALGAGDPVRQAGFEVDRQRMWSGRGRPLGDVARGRRRADPRRSVTVLRADLVGALRQAAAEAGASIRTGQRVSPAGLGRLQAEVVVGADGMWSAVRRVLVPDGPEPAYAGLYSVSGQSPADESLLPGFNWVFARRGVFIYLPAPDGTIWWSAQVAAKQPPADLTGITGAGLARLFATEPVAAAVLSAATEVRAATLMHVLPPVSRRQDGRLVLVGDAAHPVGAGQGAAMALEDAVVLARSLAAEGPARGLAAFDAERQARTARLAATTARNREAKTGGNIMIRRLREAIMPLMFPRFYESATGWLYDWEPGQLPDPVTSAG